MTAIKRPDYQQADIAKNRKQLQKKNQNNLC